MKSNSSYSIKYFPFTPGIPWKMKNSKYIVPELASTLWKDHISNKEIILACFGGLIETYFSFSILESINYVSPKLKLSWAGPIQFKFLCEMHGLAKYYPDFDRDILEDFPTPIFFDKQNRVYFNCLNNYLIVKSYYGTKGYKDKRILARQIAEKSLVPWDEKFIPKIKSFSISKELEQWINLVKFKTTTPIVLILPDHTEHTQHNINCLKWTPQQVKFLGKMLRSKNINTIVLSTQPSKYYDPNINVLPYKLEYFWYFIQQTKAIFSYDIDFLLLANILSQAKVFTAYSKHQFSLKGNNKFFNKNNYLYINKNLQPSDVFEKILEGNN
jgi:hypothetical protein